MSTNSHDHNIEYVQVPKFIMDSHFLIPRWTLPLGFVALVITLTLALFTFPASPASNARPVQAASGAQPAATVNLPPRTLASASRTLGDPNAPTQFVEFSDFQCPYCRQFALGAERQIEDQYIKTGKVSFTYKYYPILDRGAGDGESHWSAYAAECANRQGKFWEYHDKLFSAWQGENVGSFTITNLKQFAVDLQLDASAFNSCLDSGVTKSVVDADIAEGHKLGVNGTPAFFVNGQPFFPRALELAEFAARFNSSP